MLPDRGAAPLTEAGYLALYRAHRRGVRSFLWRLGVHPRDLDDLEQDVWLRVWARRAQCRPTPGAAPKDWLYRIAHNRGVDYHRDRRRSFALPLTLPDQPLDAAPAGQLPDAAALDGDRLTAIGAVRAAVSRLTPEQRRVIRFRWLYDQSLPDAIRRLGMPKDAVMQRQRRAFVHLRTALAAYDPALG